MTPKEKAIDLVYRFSNAQSEDGFVNSNKYRHKQCALIAVDELIELSHTSTFISTIKYWKEVKQEIEKL